MKRTYLDFPAVVRELGQTNDKVRYAVCYKRIVEPLTYGKARLFTTEQVDALRAYFATDEAEGGHTC